MMALKHPRILRKIPFLIVVCFAAFPAQAKYGGGTGEPNDPYQIATAADLIALGNEPNDYDKHFILTADIDLDPNLPGRKVFDKALIAPGSPAREYPRPLLGSPFTGVFDGNGHTISHLTIEGGYDLGVFGKLEGEVKNLGVVDVNITGVGDYVGGLVGYNTYGYMTRCYSTGEVSGLSHVGGLVGKNLGEVTNCYSSNTVVGTGFLDTAFGDSGGVGGLVGTNTGIVASCHSDSGVTGHTNVGGLVGLGGGIVRSYSSGAVSAVSEVGGLVGWGGATACFWDTQTSGQTASAGGTGKTTAQMQAAKTFLEAGWDFVGETANGTEDIWWILEGKDYPRLSWQGPAGMVFVDIPAGTFQMGNHDGGGADDARPVHSVTLDGYQISKCETTNSQYAEYLNAAMAGGLIRVVNGLVYASSDVNLVEAYCDTYTSSSYSQIEYSQGRFTVRSRDGKAMSDHPVARVSWYGAKAFCDHYGCRLPTEAEWEYAARGGYHDPYYRYPWGSNAIDCSKANCKTDSGFCNPLNLTSWPYTSPVGYYGPQGAYGLCDMSGNLWEWCQDWYGSSYYSVSPASNPTGPAGGTSRVLRGGAWDVHGNSCDVGGRSVASPLVRGQVVGFRVCR